MKPFTKFWQIECTDKEGGRHYWRFPFDPEGYKEVCGFKSFLAYHPSQRQYGHHNFAIWHN